MILDFETGIGERLQGLRYPKYAVCPSLLKLQVKKKNLLERAMYLRRQVVSSKHVFVGYTWI